MTPEAAGEASVVLAQYAMFLSQAAQREEANLLLLEEEILRAVAPRIAQQTVYGREEKRALAVREDEYASRLDRQRVGAAAKMKRLMFLATRVENVGRAYQALANVRRRERQYGE